MNNKKKIGDKGICEMCKKKEGEARYCPYADDVYDEQIIMVLCEDCWFDRCDDI